MVVLCFDLDGAPVEAQRRAAAAATKFVESQMRSTDQVAIATSGSGKVKVLEDFTGDHDRLIGAIGHVQSSAPTDGSGENGLLAATRMLASIRGDMVLVYLSAGPIRILPVNPDSKIRIYVINISGLPSVGGPTLVLSPAALFGFSAARK